MSKESSLKMFDVKIVIVGATGLVGQEFLNILKEKHISSQNIYVIASDKSCGKIIQYENSQLIIQKLSTFDFSSCKIALFSSGAAVSAIYAKKAAELGCFVVDNTSYFRMNDDVPLVVPEINAFKIKQSKQRIIANPNCSTIQMVMALKPMHNVSAVRKVVVSTYQSVSGAGRYAVDELNKQKSGDLTICNFKHQILHNVIPQIDTFLDNGDTKEEWKMIVETQKILDTNMSISATCVRVPVLRGHSESVSFELEDDVPLLVLFDALRDFPGIIVSDNFSHFYTPLDVVGRDEVFVSRLRNCFAKNLYNMWVVADNLRKGAALNAIQIAEKLVEYGMIV
ncbi:MAG: aspartate-semialdehyde dehydrogenase [Holosporales bacterium]|jgi:aspartate-semialdehyde dehydrogenase|nr:aspartate-semialdehyde dehydrogenase [Holosporales bacterium]